MKKIYRAELSKKREGAVKNVLRVSSNRVDGKLVAKLVAKKAEGKEALVVPVVTGIAKGLAKINVYGSDVKKISVEAERNIENSWAMVGEAMSKAFKDIANVK